ncbi:energy transducer TonB [Muribaculum intestinale]|uniref:energy transducer TonB n=1 Tax=Muribaculum intestinale TaxID=1796646 RepID=UPI000F46363C|nr:energy transducer TonB [Muribaculum intestinale]ROT07901.1 energy transducer TonB [Muribaculaceae bacterium Isolate-100 (HZI)]RXE66464.1 energy transducer TonB [Muribaculaceae bacterium Isolate-007 (NCI)]TGX87303.1 energy transducer TonB [Muribaculum intestinale]
MAKDVDLSSKEWRDIVFEGKNQQFGAYEMRKNSDARHNKAMIVVVIVIAIAFILPLLVNTVLPKAEEKPEDLTEQALVNLDNTVDEEQDQPEEEQQRVEVEIPEALPEEILNTVKVTELAIVEDEKVNAEDEIKTQDELKETTTAFGQSDFDKGTDDRNVLLEHKDEIIVEEKKPVEENKVFTAVEQMPQFPGGEAELMKYIQKNLKYPPVAMENNIQGRVVVQFVVTKTGKIGEVKVARGKDPDLDKEAVRVVKSLPDFIPGKMNGQSVNVWYTLPITFKLQGV